MLQYRRTWVRLGRILSCAFWLSFGLVVAFPHMALAQKTTQPAPRKPVPAPIPAAPPVEVETAPNRPPPPGYENDLLRLSEVMGALSFLRTLCGAPDAPEWHGRMSALIDSEARDSETRARLAGAFNQGYNGFALTYRTCTPAARMAVTRYLEEGERLSRSIAARFGG